MSPVRKFERFKLPLTVGATRVEVTGLHRGGTGIPPGVPPRIRLDQGGRRGRRQAGTARRSPCWPTTHPAAVPAPARNSAPSPSPSSSPLPSRYSKPGRSTGSTSSGTRWAA